MKPRMSLSIAAGSLLLACAVPMVAFGQQDDAVKKRLDSSPRHHEFVDIKTKAGRTVRAFVVFPEVDHPVPAVVVIHENRGLTDWVRGVADQLAEAGYVAISPDFLSQTGPNGGGTDSYDSTDAATQGIYKLDAKQVLDDLDATVAHAATMKAANGKVAVAGFCWGGGKSFEYATHNSKIAAAFVFYGKAPEADAIKHIAAPVYGFYGASDFRISGQVPTVAEQMKNHGKTYKPLTYEGAGHGFMRAGESPDAMPPNRKARDAAWAAWKEALKKL